MLETGNIYVCIQFWSAQQPFFCVHRRWLVWRTAWMRVWLSQRGKNHQRCPAWAHAGIHAANCLLIPKAIISSCLLVYILTSLKRSCGGLCVLMYHFFIAKTSHQAIGWESAADIQRFFSVSLWSNMNFISVAMRGPISEHGQVSSFWVCECLRVCVWESERCYMFLVIGWMSLYGAVTQKLLCDNLIPSLCHRRIIEIMLYCFFFLLVLSTWPRCC